MLSTLGVIQHVLIMADLIEPAIMHTMKPDREDPELS